VPHVAVVVLTGMAEEHLGQEAVRAGAQDYLVKGEVDGHLLHRVIRYSVARQLSDDMQRQLSEARIYAEENARLERGLLPSPLVSTPDLTVAARYQPGAQRMLLGGDFYDVVQSADGWVHALVGDVWRARPGRSGARRVPAGGVAHDDAVGPPHAGDPDRPWPGLRTRTAPGGPVCHAVHGFRGTGPDHRPAVPGGPSAAPADHRGRHHGTARAGAHPGRHRRHAALVRR